MSAIAFVSTGTLAERFASFSRPAEDSASSNNSRAAAAAAFLDESDDVEESAAPQPLTTLAYADTTPANEESTSLGSPRLALASQGDPSHRSVAEAEAGQLQVSASWLTEQLADLDDIRTVESTRIAVQRWLHEIGALVAQKDPVLLKMLERIEELQQMFTATPSEDRLAA
jgi:hypothetical protein